MLAPGPPPTSRCRHPTPPLWDLALGEAAIPEAQTLRVAVPARRTERTFSGKVWHSRQATSHRSLALPNPGALHTPFEAWF
ncbi:hypothetical protein PAPYR_5861 [Paratrimastix pyriformis]|uniref:Uncharacterized protein n=1 Tax=Paratrimastix pyriformis TaxID=342808 RepID=A0ABQ8ULU2_9EUKA|nr:hypothetical protein PAPYR_5861 [Paratrimastix pyriformis]